MSFLLRFLFPSYSFASHPPSQHLLLLPLVPQASNTVGLPARPLLISSPFLALSLSRCSDAVGGGGPALLLLSHSRTRASPGPTHPSFLSSFLRPETHPHHSARGFLSKAVFLIILVGFFRDYNIVGIPAIGLGVFVVYTGFRTLYTPRSPSKERKKMFRRKV